MQVPLSVQFHPSGWLGALWAILVAFMLIWRHRAGPVTGFDLDRISGAEWMLVSGGLRSAGETDGV
jgi:hypothetical protein